MTTPDTEAVEEVVSEESESQPEVIEAPSEEVQEPVQLVEEESRTEKSLKPNSIKDKFEECFVTGVKESLDSKQIILYRLIPLFLAMVKNCAKTTASSEEPKTEAVCVIEIVGRS